MSTAAFPRERVHQSFYDSLISASSYGNLARAGFLLDVSQLEVAPDSMYCGRDSIFAFDRSEARVPVFERCIYCRHDAPVDAACSNCGAKPGDRQ